MAVSWAPPPEDERNGELLGYKVGLLLCFFLMQKGFRRKRGCSHSHGCSVLCSAKFNGLASCQIGQGAIMSRMVSWPVLLRVMRARDTRRSMASQVMSRHNVTRGAKLRYCRHRYH